MRLSCFCLQFSQSQHCIPSAALGPFWPLSLVYHTGVMHISRDKIGSPSDFACYFLCPGFSVFCIFKS